MAYHFTDSKLLIIAPHADDEILGCYGLIKKMKEQGIEVYIQILTMGAYDRLDDKHVTKEEWRTEFESVCKELDIDGHDIMLYEDEIKHIDEIPKSKVIEYIEKKSPLSLFEIKPYIVAIPTIFSSHQDHIATYQSAMAALRVHSSAQYVTPELIISYESPEYHYWSEHTEFGRFTPNMHLPMTSKQVDEKVDVLYKYQSQIKTGKRDASRIRALAIMRGSEIGEEYAESFHIHRSIMR